MESRIRVNDDTRILVGMLAGTPGWDALEEYLNEMRQTAISKLLTGYQTYDEYLRLCGEIKGLDAVLTAPSTPDPKRPASRSFTPTTSRH